jgi:hypothetical protein
MNRRLTRFRPETELVELAYQNLHPDYLRQIPTGSFSSMRELMLFGHAIEEQNKRRETYVPPPKPSDMVDRELGFSRDKGVKHDSILTAAPIPAREKRSPGAKCWNCDATGHFF